jgi:Spy/CpxP family protein refolding chaperone
MKKIIIAALSSIFMIGMVAAQTPKVEHGKKQHGQHKEHGKEKYGKGKMAHHLNMSEEQKKQAKVIGENYHKQVQALKKNDNITMGEYKKQMDALKKERKAKFDGLLTTEQKTKIAEGKKKREEHAQVRGAARLEKMKINLGLKDDQVAKIKKQQDGFRSKAKAIRENGSLSDDQKKEQMKSLAKEQKESFKSILTKEQQEKLDSRKKEFKGKRGEAKK